MDVREKLVELPIEDALLVLREEHRQRTDSYSTYLARGGKGDPAEEVGLDALAMAISALEKTKWISVDDELPEDDSDVLAYSRIGEESRIYPACYSNGVWFDCVFNAPATDTTTHWMKMPHPPKVE